MVESESDSMTHLASHGSLVPSPKRREHAHWLSQPIVLLNESLISCVYGSNASGVESS